jgi:DNA-binding CsgD family transcriptional regulator
MRDRVNENFARSSFFSELRSVESGVTSKGAAIATPNSGKKSWSLLTPAERKVMYWVMQGKSNWETARILNRAESTAKKHLQRIFRKLGVENRVAAINCLRKYPSPESM